MTSSPPVTLRLPLALRVYVSAFLVVWIGVIIWMTATHNRSSSVVMGVLLCAFGAFLGYRVLRLGAQTDARGVLHVTNQWGSRQLSRDDVEEFRAGTDGGRGLGQRSIMALLRDGTTYSIDVCQAPPFGIGSNRLSHQLDTLNEWLRAR